MTTITSITSSQSGKETQANENFSAVSPAGAFGRKAATTTGLTFGYFGGVVYVDGVQTTVADGTVALTNAATNYVELSRAGTVSVNTTGFTAGRIPLYTILTAGGTQGTTTDYRTFIFQVFGRLSKSVAGSSNVTLTAAEVRNQAFEFTGTLTGNIEVYWPSAPARFSVFNNTSGAFTLTCMVSGQTGVAVTQGDRVLLETNGTDVVAFS